MPVFQLTKQLSFPHPSLAKEGLLAVGGDLSPQRLLLAYSHGIFPWYNEGEPILWHAPNPRFVLFPDRFHLSKSMKTWMRNHPYTIRENTRFEEVIRQCKQVPRHGQDGTWITEDMEKAYKELHNMGYAKSIEVFNGQEELVGGLYGVSLGEIFFGESMFHLETNCSKLAFHYLAHSNQYRLIDCQIHNEHLESLGAQYMELGEFLQLLAKYTK